MNPERLTEIRARAEGREIFQKDSQGTEIVFCDEHEGRYIGWTTREIAEANGYTVSRTERNVDVLDLLAALDEATTRAEREARAADVESDMLTVERNEARAQARTLADALKRIEADEHLPARTRAVARSALDEYKAKP